MKIQKKKTKRDKITALNIKRKTEKIEGNECEKLL